MKTKYWLSIGLSILLICGICIVHNLPEKIDCDSLSLIYLKPPELDLASKIADKYNVVVVISELNQTIARPEVFNCENFDYKNKW